MGEPALRDTLAQIIYDAGRLHALSIQERLEIADAILASEEWQAREAVLSAYERCEGNRGAFSCAELHDNRCPKSRATSPEQWTGTWRCDCGREALDAALDRLEKSRAA